MRATGVQCTNGQLTRQRGILQSDLLCSSGYAAGSADLFVDAVYYIYSGGSGLGLAVAGAHRGHRPTTGPPPPDSHRPLSAPLPTGYKLIGWCAKANAVQRRAPATAERRSRSRLISLYATQARAVHGQLFLSSWTTCGYKIKKGL